MITANLRTVSETTIVTNHPGYPPSITTSEYIIAVDDNGNTVSYQDKFRLIDGDQIFIFDDEQEYLDYLTRNYS